MAGHDEAVGEHQATQCTLAQGRDGPDEVDADVITEQTGETHINM